MKNIAAIAMKELYTYFVSPVAYFVFFIFTAVSGFFFCLIFFGVVRSQMQSDAVMESLVLHHERNSSLLHPRFDHETLCGRTKIWND